MDLSKLSNAELEQISKGDLRMLSDSTLQMLSGQESTQSAKPRLDAIQPPNFIERQLAKLPNLVSPKTENQLRGFAMGAADPSVGGAQLLANLVGQGEGVNKAIQNKEAQYEQGRAAVGRSGLDATRLLGNVASPVNLVAASKLPVATTTLGRAGVGTGYGLIGGLLQPVTDGGANYAENKIMQGGIGAATGGVLSPILGKVGDKLTRSIGLNKPQASLQTDSIIKDALQKVGMTADDIGQPELSALRSQVMQSLESGKVPDIAAQIRQKDFNALGIKPTLGQLTRDPTLFARERNLRGVAGVGEPLMQRLDQQNRQLQQIVSGLRGSPSENYPAGRNLIDTLKTTDEGMRKQVSAAYQAAKQSAGKDAEIPMAGIANDYMTTLDEFADKVPAGVRNQFKKFGLEGEKQTKLFTVEEADKLIKTINDHVGMDRATNTALSRLRDSVKKAVVSDAGVEDVFSPARKAAAERFKLQDAIPALKAAAQGDVSPDDFVKRFIVGGKTEEVKGLASVLSKNDPAAFKEARDQIGAKLMRDAFGENLAGDKLPAPERLAKAIREMGSEKLSAFYTKAEIDQLNQVAKVSAYINSIPSGSPVNSSNTASAAMNLLTRIPGVPAGLGMLNAVKNSATQSSAVNRAVNPVIPTTAAPIDPNIARLLGQIRNGASFASGGLLSGAVGQQ